MGGEGLGAVREPPLHDDPFASREGWWVDCLDRGLRGFSQMAYDAPRPFVPGFWVAACAGMTWASAGMTGWGSSPGQDRGAVREPPLHGPLTRVARGVTLPSPIEGEGDLTACFAFLWVPACAGKTGLAAGMTGVHPHPGTPS